VDPSRIARAQGIFNVIGGAWPIVGLRSFEFVYGPKKDVFLQKTVGGLLASIGVVQLTAGGTRSGLDMARRLGIAAAATLLAVDVIYMPRGQMRWTYTQDALCELVWLGAWLRTNPGPS
jgi:hypothetical protein